VGTWQGHFGTTKEKKKEKWRPKQEEFVGRKDRRKIDGGGEWEGKRNKGQKARREESFQIREGRIG